MTQEVPKLGEQKPTHTGAQMQSDGSMVAVVTGMYVPLKSSSAGELSKSIKEQAKAIRDGDLSQLEAMLLNQAIALQAMFIDLAARAKKAPNDASMQTLTQLALKSATGSRQTIAVLTEMKSPRSVAFVQQANISHGPQQVNNGETPVPASPARTEKSVNPENELLEEHPHEQWMDTGTARPAGAADPRMEAVGALHGADHAGGQGGGRTQR